MIHTKFYQNVIIFLSLFLTSITHAKFAITTSGGVSLGSYKAGFLYYLTETIKRNPELSKNISHFTGASAGGINSYIAINSLCSDKQQEYSESLFWKTWIPIGINDLFQKEKVQRQNLFTRDAFNRPLTKLEQQFNRGFKKGCKFYLGIPLTHAESYHLELTENVNLPALRDFVLIKIEGNGFNKSPKVQNFLLTKYPKRQLLLPFTKNPNSNFNLIKKLLFATSAFPIAFKPINLPVCIRTAKNNLKICNTKNSKHMKFIDGGVFDNAPLSISRDIAIELNGKNNNFNFGYLNASNQNFPEAFELNKNSNELKGAIGTITHFMGNFVNAARNIELTKLLDESPELKDRIYVAKAQLPPISSPMYAFFGFYERTFREFDFHLGMSDANKFINDLAYNKNLNLPHKDNWNLFHCLNGVKYEEPKSIKLCLKNHHKINQNLKIIFQVSLNRLFNHCSKVDMKKIKNNKFCLIASVGNKPDEYIYPNRQNIPWKQKTLNGVEVETEEAYIIRMLDFYNFQYQDLDKNYSEQISGADKIFYSQSDILDSFNEKQPAEDQQFIGILKSTLLNRLQYAPPKSTTYFNIGNALEVGKTWTYSLLPKSMTIQSSFIFQDLHSYLGSEDDNISITPTVGFSYIPNLSNNISFRPILGLDFGYQFSLKDNMGQQNCKEKDYQSRSTNCSGKVIIPSIKLTLLDRVQVKLAFGIHDKKTLSKAPRSGLLMVGYQFH